MKINVCIGGPRSGQRIPATGQPEYRFPKEIPLSKYVGEDGQTYRTYEDRYIRKDAYFDGVRHALYVWEHDIHRDLIELLTSELCRARGQA